MSIPDEWLGDLLRRQDRLAGEVEALRRDVHALVGAVRSGGAFVATTSPDAAPPALGPVPGGMTVPISEPGPISAPMPMPPMRGPQGVPGLGPGAPVGHPAGATMPPQQPYPNRPQPGVFFPPPQGAPVPVQHHQPVAQRNLTPRVLGGVGAALTLVGLVFVLTEANSWFGPTARMGAAFLLGAALAGIAFVVNRRVNTDVAGAIMATGGAAAFLGVVSTGGQQHLPGVWGVLVASLVGLFVATVARAWSSQWLGTVAVTATLLLTPVVTSNWYVAAVSMTALTCVTLAFQFGVRWPVFALGRVVPTLGWVWYVLAIDGPPAQNWVALWCAVALAASGLAQCALSRLMPASDRRLATGLMLLLAGPVTWGLATDINPTRLPVGGLVLLGVLAAVFAAAGLVRVLPALGRAAALGIAGGCAVLLVDLFTPWHEWVWASVAVAVLTFVGWRGRDRVIALVGAALLAPLSILLLTLSFDHAALLEAYQPDPGPVFLAGYPATIAAVVFVGLTMRALRQWWLAYPVAVLAAMFEWRTIVTIGQDIGYHHGFFILAGNISSAAVTVSWAAACAVFLRIGLRRPNLTTWLHLGLGFAAGAVVKLLLLDLHGLSNLSRALAFVGTGLLLLAIGVTYARALERAKAQAASPGQQPPPGQLD